jgi:hypothetical protein
VKEREGKSNVSVLRVSREDRACAATSSSVCRLIKSAWLCCPHVWRQLLRWSECLVLLLLHHAVWRCDHVCRAASWMDVVIVGNIKERGTAIRNEAKGARRLEVAR